MIKYFPETNEFLAGCFGDFNENRNFYYTRYTEKFETSSRMTIIDNIISNNCGSPNNIDFIYSSYNNKYSILTSESNNCCSLITINQTNIDLNCFHYFNYEKTNCLDCIPDGYFLNDSNLKTLDKCYPYCKTCDKKETENNNNCNSCIDNKYLDLGNCVSECDKGTFIDPNDNSIIRCKCNNLTKCEFCTPESINLNLCLTCNKDLGYYPICNDSKYFNINIYTNNTDELFIDCYKEPDNYFLDNYTSSYMPCYKTCKKCYGKGDEQYNNCLECQINYTFLNESKNDTNCYDKCTFYYYFDNEKNKHHCTTENKCPENYPFIIRNKSKCIDDCKKDNIYTFAFNNECYIEGPSINIYTDVITEIYQTEYPSINKETEIITEISQTEYPSINKDINMEICPKEFPYLNKETNTCIKECNANDFLTFKCSTDNENDEIKENNLIKIKNAISGHEIDDLLDGILVGGEDVTIYDKNTKYQLTSSSNQNENINEYKDISVIKLGECENVLKQVYKNISENDSLLIFKTDFNIEGYSTDIVEYEIYHPKTKEKLDLKNCEKNSIEIYQSASIDENELFKYNPNDPFYFDICSKFTTKNNIDITLFDRCEIFVNNNFSLCENDCIFSDYDYNLKKVICKCNIKVNFANIYDITKEKFNNNNCIQNLFNIKVMKCYNRLFDKDGLKKNIGNNIFI